MTRARVLLLALILSVPGVVLRAQDRTSDGVAAMLRGDYQQAAAILEPIAESWRRPDPAAAFFMATLYETGRGGVPVDPMRACALYQQSFSDEGSVYSPTAQLLQRRLWTAQGNDFFQECQLVANIGIGHHFQPETFTLGAGHRVEWTLGVATVTYESRTTRSPWGFMGPRGLVFLPLRHLELRPPTSPAVVHLFEMFWWEPSAAQWTLRVRLFEVYRDAIAPVDSPDALTTVTAAEPPSLTQDDLRTLVTVEVNAAGAIELRVGGLHPERRTVVTQAEKLVALEKERARAAADARVDWNAALDVDRAPSFTYADAQGCANIFLYASTADRGEVVTFRADARSLRLTPQPRRFDLAALQRAFSLQVHVYERPVRANPCSDFVTQMPAASAWEAVSGIVEIELSPRGIDPGAEHRQRATVRILSAEFVGPAGKRIRLNRPIVLTAIVGDWFG